MAKCRRGGQHKYLLHILEVGESMLLPWLQDSQGRHKASQAALHQAVIRAMKGNQKAFSKWPEAYGLRVKRLA